MGGGSRGNLHIGVRTLCFFVRPEHAYMDHWVDRRSVSGLWMGKVWLADLVTLRSTNTMQPLSSGDAVSSMASACFDTK